MLCAVDLVHQSLPIKKAHGRAYPLPEGRGSRGSNCCRAAAVSRYSYIHIRLPLSQSSPPSNGLCMSQYTGGIKVIQENFRVWGLGRGSVKKCDTGFFPCLVPYLINVALQLLIILCLPQVLCNIRVECCIILAIKGCREATVRGGITERRDLSGPAAGDSV